MYNPEIQPDMNMSKETYKSSTAPTINHFYEKLLLLKDRMNTKAGKEIADSFYLGERESTKDDVSSVYGVFRMAHIATLKLYRCSKKSPCENAIELLNDAKLKRDKLYARIDQFLLDLHSSFDSRFNELQKM